MKTDEIIEKLNTLMIESFRREESGDIVPVEPVLLSTKLLHIRGLLLQLVDKVYDAERDYRLSKSARFDKLLKEGMKRSPASDQLDMEADLIEKKVATERVRNFMKYTDGLCTSMQSVLKVQASGEKGQY